MKCEPCEGKGWHLVTVCPGRIQGIVCARCMGEGTIFKTADQWLAAARRDDGKERHS